ncbi:conserved exported hypothetical protein [uncultured Defluviicoccus sp.]|uniref:DUF995 domain-containing protein n=1 Tax=metagenome TaxID=256318 RepID=A0A380T896_9ZZZZ|nr:conserved exported hypothetical protein [uncultured Defluviicoccus sp.]
MKRMLVALGAALAITLPAAADTLDSLYKNTLTLTDTRGGVYTLLISEGGKMEQTNSVGTWAAGVWYKDATKGFCWTARGAATLCIPMPADKDVGDTWEIRSPVGQLSWVAAIVEGRADLTPNGGSATAGEHGDH